jgi:hypothetical protein
MPFKSAAQMSACFRRRPPGWDCEEWLDKTDVCSLPNRSGDSQKDTARKPSQPKPKLGPIKTGPRGGRYREVKQGNCVKKIYL